MDNYPYNFKYICLVENSNMPYVTHLLFHATQAVLRHLLITRKEIIDEENIFKKLPILLFLFVLFDDQQLTSAFPTILDNICGSSRSRSSTPICKAGINNSY